MSQLRPASRTWIKRAATCPRSIQGDGLTHRSWLSTIIIDCNDAEAGAAFWSRALGVGITGRDEPFVWLEAPPGTLGLGIQAVPEPKTAKSRVHLDIGTDDLEAEVSRLESLGAVRREQLGDWLWVMHDPCGNEFCVFRGDGEAIPERARRWSD